LKIPLEERGITERAVKRFAEAYAEKEGVLPSFIDLEMPALGPTTMIRFVLCEKDGRSFYEAAEVDLAWAPGRKWSVPL